MKVIKLWLHSWNVLRETFSYTPTYTFIIIKNIIQIYILEIGKKVVIKLFKLYFLIKKILKMCMCIHFFFLFNSKTHFVYTIRFRTTIITAENTVRYINSFSNSK